MHEAEVEWVFSLHTVPPDLTGAEQNSFLFQYVLYKTQASKRTLQCPSDEVIREQAHKQSEFSKWTLTVPQQLSFIVYVFVWCNYSVRVTDVTLFLCSTKPRFCFHNDYLPLKDIIWEGLMQETCPECSYRHNWTVSWVKAQVLRLWRHYIKIIYLVNLRKILLNIQERKKIRMFCCFPEPAK